MNPTYRFLLKVSDIADVFDPETSNPTNNRMYVGGITYDEDYLLSGFIPLNAKGVLVFNGHYSLAVFTGNNVSFENNIGFYTEATTSIEWPNNARYFRVCAKAEDYYDVLNVNFWKSTHPIYDGSLSVVYEKYGSEQFFRKNLNNKLKYAGNDYTYILAKTIEVEFTVLIQVSYDAGINWSDYWLGSFCKTDCEIDIDSRVISVTPNVLDEYTDILAGIDNEYNLIDLLPVTSPVKVYKRPLLQFYCEGGTVITSIVGGMYFEQECDVVDASQLVSMGFYESLSRYLYILEGEVNAVGINSFPTGYSLTPGAENIITETATGKKWSFTGQQEAGGVVYNPVTSTGATQKVVFKVSLVAIWSRLVLDKSTYNGDNTRPLIDSDIFMKDNRNYHYSYPINVGSVIYITSGTTSSPTQYGLKEPGKYYAPPIVANTKMLPIARNNWGVVSYWFGYRFSNTEYDTEGTADFLLKDSYLLSDAIGKILLKIAPDVSFGRNTDYSQFLFAGTNPLTGRVPSLLVVPKSNILKGDYDQPAQKAPATLGQFLEMLRNCYRCYWFVEDGKLRIEHIEFFRNGGQYSSNANVGLDLTELMDIKTQKPLSYGQNIINYDKVSMPQRYEFGWTEQCSETFSGQPIEIVSRYVQSGLIENIIVNGFCADIDLMMVNPGAFSLDGFALIGGEPDMNAIGSRTPIYTLSTQARKISFDPSVIQGQGVMIVVDVSEFHGDMATMEIAALLERPVIPESIEYLQWDSPGMFNDNNRYAIYLTPKVQTGDVIKVKLSNYTLYHFAVVILTGHAWGQGTVISDSGWQSANYEKTIESNESGYYLRITLARNDNGTFTLEQGNEVLVEHSAERQSAPSGGDVVIDSKSLLLTGLGQYYLTWNNFPPAASALAINGTFSGTIRYRLVSMAPLEPWIFRTVVDYFSESNNEYRANVQNMLLAFRYLQQYYLYDMPARRIIYQGSARNAIGIIKSKRQNVVFPARIDPEIIELIKTDIGNGQIEKLSINLSSRSANATLIYDPE